MEKQKNIPKLRFPEYRGEWDSVKLGVILIEGKLGGNYENAESNCGIPVIKMGNLGRGEINLDKIQNLPENELYNQDDILKEGDLLFNTRNTLDLVGKVSIWRNELPLALYNSNLMRMRFNNNIEPTNRFMNYCFNTKKSIDQLRSFATGTTSVAAIYGKDLRSLKVIFPPLPEQTKIASFLTTVDERLSQLKQKKTLLEQYKKGVMQKIFAQDIRFSPDQGDEFPEWEVKTLGVLAERMTVKNKEGNTNVLTISAQQGLVSQLEFFNKSVSAKDVTGYYLLKKDDFAYNKSYSNGYPMGAIKRLKYYEKGVVSTLYICFTFKDSVNLSFMEQYFESGIHNQEIEKVAQEGARNHGLLNIGLSDFFSTEIVLPCLEEQTKIANFLSAIDEKVNGCSNHINKTEQYKKGLLQQMFV